MELISESFSQCKGGRRSGIDLRNRVLGGKLEDEEEEKEGIVGISTSVKRKVYK